MAGKKVNLNAISDVITVNMYGGKSIFKNVRDQKYRAEVVSCDCESCSLRDKGMCLKVTSFSSIVASHNCKYGQKHIFEGYTPKAAACADWKYEFTSHPKFRVLDSVGGGIHFAVIGDYYFIYTVYVAVAFAEDGTLEKRKQRENNAFFADKVFDTEKKDWVYKGYAFETAMLSSDTKHLFIPKDKVDLEFLKYLLTYRPRALFGGEVKDYREKVVTLILKQMRGGAPELYEKLVAAYPELGSIAPNFIGKYVYVKTLKPDIDICIQNQGVFHLSADRKTLTCKDYCGGLLPFRAKHAEITIPVTDDMKFQVTDNDQTCDDTEIAS